MAEASDAFPADHRVSIRRGPLGARLKFPRDASDNPDMRWSCLLLLAASGLAFAGAVRPVPRGNDHFRLAMTWAQVDSSVAARGLEVISSSHEHLTCAPSDPAVEFEQYSFLPSAQGPSYLWRVTIAYRVPYRRADFESLRHQLGRALGDPAEVVAPDDSGAVHKVTWVDPATAVQLAARWPEHPDPRVDRMMVTWTDRRLQRLVEARRQKDKKPR